MTPTPLVGIVLVNWNATSDTVECLSSLKNVSYEPFFAVVVDNASREDPTRTIAEASPATTVLRLPCNLGFTGGNNAGIAYACERGADYVLCLNNDTTVAPDFLALLVDAFRLDRRIGLATAAIYRHSRPAELIALGCEVDLSSSPPAWHRLPTTTPPQVPHDVGFGEGCALMLARSVVEATGGFDNAFFAYAEDADLCLRARKLGWRCVVVPNSIVWHKIDGKSTGHHSDTALFYFYRNVWRLLRRHGTESERQRFLTSHGHLLRNEVIRYLRTHASRAERGSADVARGQLLAVVLGTLAGLLGCRGDRRRCSALETTLRLILSPPLEFLGLAAGLLAPMYRKLGGTSASRAGRPTHPLS